ncbi:MAG: hypothetical protein RIS76_1502 [Verrucomicrobiota bacterium]|jgi:hypothetical protein
MNSLRFNLWFVVACLLGFSVAAAAPREIPEVLRPWET